VQPAPDGFIDPAKAWLVVADDHELELRRELEEVLAHVAALEPVATGERLDLRLGPGSPDLDFTADSQADTAQASDFGRVAIGIGDHQHFSADRECVVTHDLDEGIDEHGFAVGAGAVEEKQCMFGDAACEAITRDASEVMLQVLITGGDAL
jgi:hypothetical protein